MYGEGMAQFPITGGSLIFRRICDKKSVKSTINLKMSHKIGMSCGIVGNAFIDAAMKTLQGLDVEGTGAFIHFHDIETMFSAYYQRRI